MAAAAAAARKRCTRTVAAKRDRLVCQRNGKEYWARIEDEVIAQVHALKSMNPKKAASDPLGLLRDAEKRALKQVGIDPDEKTKAAEAKKKADDARRLRV
jgi:hypothetical protein